MDLEVKKSFLEHLIAFVSSKEKRDALESDPKKNYLQRKLAKKLKNLI